MDLSAQVEAARAASFDMPGPPYRQNSSSTTPDTEDVPSDATTAATTSTESAAEFISRPHLELASRSGGIPFTALLDNAEDGNNSVLHVEFGLRGFWYTADASWDCGSTRPFGFTSPIPTDYPGGGEFTATEYAEEGITPPPESVYETNEYGLRFWGGRQQGFGSLLGVGLNHAGALNPADLVALDFVSVRFWGLAPCGPVELSVHISDKYSDPGQGFCVPQDQTTCTPQQGCHDSPVVRVRLTDEWQLFEIPLTSFVRQGTGIYVDGVEPPLVLDATSAILLQFIVRPTPLFDVWLDNVGFVYSR